MFKWVKESFNAVVEWYDYNRRDLIEFVPMFFCWMIIAFIFVYGPLYYFSKTYAIMNVAGLKWYFWAVWMWYSLVNAFWIRDNRINATIVNFDNLEEAKFFGYFISVFLGPVSTMRYLYINLIYAFMGLEYHRDKTTGKIYRRNRKKLFIDDFKSWYVNLRVKYS